MKKIIFALCLVFAMSASLVQAQEDVKVRFGGAAAFSMTQWSGDNYVESSFVPGGRIGVVSELVINPKWSIQPEILFSYEGTKLAGYKGVLSENQLEGMENAVNEIEGIEVEDITGAFGNDDSKVTAKAMYIKIPMLLYYNITRVGPGQLSPGVGPYFGFGIGGKCEGINTLGQDGIADKFDWGFQLRVSYELTELNAGKVNGIFAYLGYEQGLTKTYNMGLLVGVGYKFPYSKWLRSAGNKGIFKYN